MDQFATAGAYAALSVAVEHHTVITERGEVAGYGQRGGARNFDGGPGPKTPRVQPWRAD